MDWRNWLCIWTLAASSWALAQAPSDPAPSTPTATQPVSEVNAPVETNQVEPAQAEAQIQAEQEQASSEVVESKPVIEQPTVTETAPTEITPKAATPVPTPVAAPTSTVQKKTPSKPKKAIVNTQPKKAKTVKKRLSKKERLALKKQREEKLEQLKTLADNGEYEKGYALASTMLDDLEGQDKFDFYYGLHALETGRANEASFTFERLTLLNPQVLRYRLELARSLFYNNNLESSKNEFQMALASEPPKNVQENIRNFLKRIKNAQRGATHKFNGGLDMAYGFDSNINSATEEKGVTFPDLGFIRLQDEARSLSSTFKSLNTQFNYGFSPLPKHSLDVSFSSTHKRNDELSNYDLDVINGFAGYSWQSNRIRFQGGLNLSNVSLDGEDYQSQNGLNAMAIYTTKRKTSFAANINLATRTSDNENLPDADVFVAGFNSSWLKGQIEATNISVYLGDESVDDVDLEHFGKGYFGASYNNKLIKSKNLSRTLMVSLQNSSYQAATPVFDKKRTDTSIMASWGYEWKPWKYISWHGEASVNHNSSNLDLYTFYRAIISTGIRVAF